MTTLDNEKLENVSGGIEFPHQPRPGGDSFPKHPASPLETLSFEELVREAEKFESLIGPNAGEAFQRFKPEMFKFWKEKNPEEYEKHKAEVDAIIGEN
ncbi:MAG: hypothetical protein Q4D57_01225 [Clostridia bacterium]|nr:hypothetical protein [Clostridia bacterium]